VCEREKGEDVTDWYKVLVDGKACHGGNMMWSLPVADGVGGYVPGAWHVVDGPVEVCRRGLHLTSDPVAWMRTGAMIYRAEGAGEFSSDGSDKTAFALARLLAPAPDMIPEWWTAWLPFVRDEIPATPFFQPDGDPDPAWRLFAGESWAAAEAAAWATARNAAWAAARYASQGAAWDAARGAARDAARAAARDAARDAARATAWHAARAAADAAARTAVRAAAWDAAEDAALYACTEFVCADLPLGDTHRDHARARWNVWRKGYALVGDVDGVLYVYAREEE
jgi:hypothetical protein